MVLQQRKDAPKPTQLSQVIERKESNVLPERRCVYSGQRLIISRANQELQALPPAQFDASKGAHTLENRFCYSREAASRPIERMRETNNDMEDSPATASLDPRKLARHDTTDLDHFGQEITAQLSAFPQK